MQSDTHNQQLSEKGRMALHWAKLGLCVFPVQNGTKDKLLAGGWQTVASNDLAQVEQWWTENSDANIGCNLAKSGLVAVDADIYKPECEFNAFMQGRDLPATLTQKSARGGFHLIFRAEDAAKYPGKLCEATEIKHNGYIMLAPSTFAGGIYTVENWAEPAPCPEWVSSRQASAFDAHTPLTPINDPNPAAPITDERHVELICGSPANAAHYNGTSDLAEKNTSEATFALTCAACLFSSDEEQVRRVVMASPLVQNSPPKGSETRAQKVQRLWATEYPKAARRGAQERQQQAQAAAHGAQIAAAIGQPASVQSATLDLNALLRLVETTPPRLFTTAFLTPVGEVTLLSANGGVGKTMFALMWSVCTAFGLAGLPMQINGAAPVFFATAEDTALECARRLKAIFEALHLNMAGAWAHEGSARFHLWDVDGAPLWVESREAPAGTATPALVELERRIAATGAKQVFIDNASSVFHANHNDLTAVNAFIGALRRIAARTDCNIVLLAHVSAENATKGTPKTYYGSAAWHNSVRSRMFMELKPAENGIPEHIAVIHEKSNYGPKAEPFKLKRNPENGVLSSFTNHEIASAIDEELAPFVEQVFAHMNAAKMRGETIRAATAGQRTTYHCLAELFPKDYPDGSKDKKQKVKLAIERLFESGRIAKHPRWANGNYYQSWEVVPSDDPQNGRGA